MVANDTQKQSGLAQCSETVSHECAMKNIK